MSYTELNLNGKTYKFELTFQGLKNAEKNLEGSILILLTSTKNQLETVSELLIQGLRKHHASEVENKENFLDQISSREFTKLAAFIGKQFEQERSGDEGKPKAQAKS